MASVIQGSVISPASFIVTTSDLQTVHASNVVVKFAVTTPYVIVPAVNLYERADERQDMGREK